MLNIKKICRAVLMAAFVCAFAGEAICAEVKDGYIGKKNIDTSLTRLGDPQLKQFDVYTLNGKQYFQGAQGRWHTYEEGKLRSMQSNAPAELTNKLNELKKQHQEQTEAEWRSTPEGALMKNLATGANVTASDSKKVNNAPANGVMLTGTTKEKCEESCQAPAKCVYNNGGYTCASSDADAPDKGIGTNTTQAASTVTGCSSNYGLFSGLIDTGRKIFKGLRDLIYVVAGFGIIGVAVGGFFGNLNWKWLGAIVIALVVIATTGEIINMITGCENFTKAMIEDTLK